MSKCITRGVRGVFVGCASILSILASGASAAEPPAPSAAPEPSEAAEREASLQLQNNRAGSTGLLWLSAASSSAPGTFRLSVLGTGYDGSGFLCNKETPCAAVGTHPAGGEDTGSQLAARFALSVTPLSFLEAYATVLIQGTSDDYSEPKLIQILGDTDIGVKGFMPYKPGRWYSFGGEAQVWFLTGAGDVGAKGNATSAVFRALGTADLTNLPDDFEPLPLRVHANVGYALDNSANLVAAQEKSSGFPISRPQRFALNVDAVDSLLVGVGVEGVLPYVHPFVEWNIDVPINRTNYTCDPATVSPGDQCLASDAKFSSTPSRLTLGARGYPVLPGLALTAAIDIGTGATSNFIQEVSPQVPWAVTLGAGYAFDVIPRVETIEKRVEVKLVPPPIAHLSGVVAEQGTAAPIPGAVLTFEGGNLPAMASGSDGSFASVSVPPGSYTLAVTADGYRPGKCTAIVPELPSAANAPPAGAPAYGATPAPIARPEGAPEQTKVLPDGQLDISVRVQCELEALPTVGNIVGVVLESSQGAQVPNATVIVTDSLGRTLEMQTDGSGNFTLSQVQPGVVQVAVRADGYLTSVTEYTMNVRGELKPRVWLNVKPKTPNVVVAGNEVKLKEQVHFQTNSAEILPDSQALVAEIADVLREKGFKQVEVQGHTDNTGTAAYNLRLSQERANAVREALIKLGIPPISIIAKGYGQENPLVPNTSDRNKAKNRRVRIVILDR